MLASFVKSDRFSLVVLAMAGAAGLLWYLRPQLGWLPLLIALAPWALRMAVGVFPFQPSPLDLPMALFMATAAGGLWLAYDETAAQAKYWLIIGAVLIFYALVAQPRQNLWLLAGLLTLFGTAVAFYFLLTHDWLAQPAKIQFLNELGLRWMAIRPSLPTDTIHPNVAAGFSAVTVPFPIAIGLRGLRSGHRWPLKQLILLFAGLTGLFLLFVLSMTTSRGAWLALGVALILWVLWEVSSIMAAYRQMDPRLVFSVSLITLGAVGMFLVFTYPGGPLALINQLPGPSNIDSRAGLVRDTVHLIGDFPLLGAGLGAFPGLYSQYILILPSYVLGHSHNLLLDVTLEQGPLGLLAFVCILGGSFLMLMRYDAGDRRIRHFTLLRWAVTSSLMVLLLHGLIDDPFYGSRAVLFLFLLPGLAVAVARPHTKEVSESRAKRHNEPVRPNFRIYAAGAVLTLALFFFIIFASKEAIVSAWHSNLGAVEMARVELANWPTDEWDDGRNAADLVQAEATFNRALAANPANATAHYRLGLIAMLKRDFPSAIAHLEAAYQLVPNNQGVQKTLGYSYAWAGDFENAFVKLHTVHEARQEMNVYITWWTVQGRNDLSDNATIMARRLQTVETIPAN